MPNQEAEDDLKQQNDDTATSGSNVNANSNSGGLSFGNSAVLGSGHFFFKVGSGGLGSGNLGGLGFGTSASSGCLRFGNSGGLGFDRLVGNDAEEDDSSFLTSAFGKKIEEGAERRNKEKEKMKLQRSS